MIRNKEQLINCFQNIFTLLNDTANLWVRYYCCLHLTDEKTEAGKGYITRCPWSQLVRNRAMTQIWFSSLTSLKYEAFLVHCICCPFPSFFWVIETESGIINFKSYHCSSVPYQPYQQFSFSWNLWWKVYQLTMPSFTADFWCSWNSTVELELQPAFLLSLNWLFGTSFFPFSALYVTISTG